MFSQFEDRFGQVCHTGLGRFMLESHRSLTSRVHLLRSPHHIYHAVCPKPGGSRGSCANLAVFATGGRHGDYRAGRLEGGNPVVYDKLLISALLACPRGIMWFQHRNSGRKWLQDSSPPWGAVPARLRKWHYWIIPLSRGGLPLVGGDPSTPRPS